MDVQPFPPSGVPGPQSTPQRRNKRRILIVVAVVVVLCAGLCGVGQLITNYLNQDDWEGRGSPVPASTVAAAPTPSWKPSNQFIDPQPVQEIRHQLEGWVLASAGVNRPITSACQPSNFTGQAPAKLTCTVKFDGREVQYTVDARPTGSSVFTWEAKAEQTVVTRGGLQALLARSPYSKGDWSDLRCEEFPEIALVPVGQNLGQVCYAKLDGRVKTSKIRITPADKSEPRLVTEHQEEGLG